MKANLSLQKETTYNCSWELDTQMRFVQNTAYLYWSNFNFFFYEDGELSDVVEVAKLLRLELENATEKVTRVEAELQFLQVEEAAHRKLN